METIPLSAIDLTDRERAYAADAVASGWLSANGSYVGRFEQALARQVGRGFAIATTSGTTALDLILRALGIGPGDEVIVPALTFVSPATAVVAVGATPVFADIAPSSWTIDPDAAERLRSDRTRALIAVDLLGHPCDYDRLQELGLPIVEDAAQAHGALYKDRRIGTFGVASAFSFHANKPISTGEGGCVVTDDPELARLLVLLNGHGMDPRRPYRHEVVGRNYRMTNSTAAIGLAQVERWDELIDGRNRVSAAYDRGLRGSDFERRPLEPWATEGTWLHTVSTSDRDRVLGACAAAGVDARAIWPAVPDQPIFRDAAAPDPCPVAREVSARAMWLPTWSGMPASAIDRVVETLLAS